MVKIDPKTCPHQLTISMQLTIEGNNLINMARCPECQVLFKFIRPLNDKPHYLPLVGISFFQCPTCGNSNNENWEYAGEYGSQNDQILRIVTTCKTCQNRYMKAVSSILWDDLLTIIENHVEMERKAKRQPYQPSIKETKVPAPKPIPKSRAYSTRALKCPSCGGPTIKYQELCEDCMQKRDKQMAQLLFTCKKCKGSQISVQKMKMDELSVQKTQIITSAKCPKCGKSTQIVLDSLKIGDWIDPLKHSFFTCGICGSSCEVIKTEMKKNIMKVYFYCDRDWIEIQKEIPVALFPVLMTQIQKISL